MKTITAAQLAAYRAQTYRLKPALKLKSERDTVAFVSARGFVYLWPIKQMDCPNNSFRVPFGLLLKYKIANCEPLQFDAVR